MNRTKHTRSPSRLLQALLLASALSPLAAVAASELDSLRSENAALKARLKQLEASCPAVAAPTPAAPPTSSAPTAAASPAAPATAAMPVVAAPAPASPAPATPSPPPAAPPGYKLVPVAPPNSETGCSHGLLGQLPDAPWRQADNWSSLRRSMKPREVEELLGTDHFDVETKGLTAWQYGKCGKSAQGQVVFKAGEVLFWNAPDF